MKYHKNPGLDLGTWPDFLTPPEPENLRKLFFVALTILIAVAAGIILLA